MDWKRNNYNSIFVIINQFIKMIYYKLVNIIINVLGLEKIIINIVVRHYDFSDIIIIDQELLFTLKFWLLLHYFLGINQKISIAFYL